MTSIKRIRVGLLFAASALTVASAGTAFAQTQTPPADDATAVGEVTVTASRIRGVAAVGSNVVSIGREEILQSGSTTTADILRKAPQIVALGASATASSAQNGAANVTRGSAINLRGVGSNATLILLDGKRMPPAGTQGQFTDPSVIPSIALERLEIVADGASAIYGSDAVTGVVNMITRRNVNGLEGRVRYGSANGYDEVQASLLAGKTWDTGSIVLAYEHVQNSVLTGNERDFYTSDLRAKGGSDFRSLLCVPGNIVVAGVSYAIPAGGVTAANVGTLTPGTSNRCDLIKGNTIIPSMKRDNMFLHARQELTDTISVFFEGYRANRRFAIIGGGAAGLAPATGAVITSANPYFLSPVAGAASVTVQTNYIDQVGTDINPGKGTSEEAVVGIDFKLPGDWKGQLSFLDSSSHDEVNRAFNVTASALTAAGSSSVAANALDPFGARTTPAVFAGIRSSRFNIVGDPSMRMAELRADGKLFAIAGGDVRAAIGAEYREDALTTDLYSGTTSAPVLVHSAVTRHATSVYGEAFVPIIGSGNAQPFIQALNLSLAGRYESYSDFGETSNPKVGVTWTVVDGFNLKASYGTSFRAPSPVEYDTVGGGAGLYGDNLAGPGGAQIFGIGIAGGNASLEPEEATTWSTGFELRPSLISGFSASVNYFNIDYTNQIFSLRGTPGLLTNPLYASFVNLSPTTQQINDLLASGLVINTPINASLVRYIADGRRQNLGSTEARGFDFDLGYRFATPIGDADIGFNGAYFTHYKTTLVKGVPLASTVNLIGNPPRFRAQADAGLRHGPFTGRIIFNYVNAYTNNANVAAIQKVSSYTTADLHLGMDLNVLGDHAVLQDANISLDVQNLADKDPPYVNISGGYDPQMATPIGRMVAVSLRKKF